MGKSAIVEPVPLKRGSSGGVGAASLKQDGPGAADRRARRRIQSVKDGFEIVLALERRAKAPGDESLRIGHQGKIVHGVWPHFEVSPSCGLS